MTEEDFRVIAAGYKRKAKTPCASAAPAAIRTEARGTEPRSAVTGDRNRDFAYRLHRHLQKGDAGGLVWSADVCHFSSFRRQLSYYAFKAHGQERDRAGKAASAFSHPNFHRDMTEDDFRVIAAGYKTKAKTPCVSTGAVCLEARGTGPRSNVTGVSNKVHDDNGGVEGARHSVGTGSLGRDLAVQTTQGPERDVAPDGVGDAKGHAMLRHIIEATQTVAARSWGVPTLRDAQTILRWIDECDQLQSALGQKQKGHEARPWQAVAHAAAEASACAPAKEAGVAYGAAAEDGGAEGNERCTKRAKILSFADGEEVEL
ncbi:hypothetical protein JKP88DRAFT_350028 [Tribonema minus]|uniref:HSF-type DNA-binding domain-containing protein n=1 Tax=Tribonema minus TaxID=303371 RepID=A0A835YPN7_9STRA|nr:hypothetical protein JKP88DRAFT_350028 [Tribonema minus]